MLNGKTKDGQPIRILVIEQGMCQSRRIVGAALLPTPSNFYSASRNSVDIYNVSPYIVYSLLMTHLVQPSRQC